MSPRSHLATWGGNRGKRLPKSAYEGRRSVHVVISGFEHRPFFLAHSLAGEVFELARNQSATRAACLMPDHLHWLLSGEEDFSGIVQRFKSYSTRIAWSAGHQGKLWQRSFYDHVVRREEGVLAVAEYIVGNPVRAKMVDQWTDYPYSCLRLE